MRDRLLLIASLGGICVLAWLYLWWMAREMYGAACPMHAVTSWTPEYFVMTVTMWVIMMVAMMLPSAAPMILTVDRIARQRRNSQWPAYLFTIGYIVVWAGFSVLATLLQWTFQATGLLSPTTLSVTPAIGGLLLVAAGIYQCTHLKSACLARCNPLQFLLHGWRDGSTGAFVMGFHHGAFCVGCCSFLMLLLFVAGVMNLLWIALLGAVVLIEKMLPADRRVSRAVAAVPIVFGVALAVEGFVHG